QRRLHVADGRPGERDLDVVPRGPRPVHRREGPGAGVAAVVDVVAAGHGDVDAADVGDVLRRGVAVPDDDGLLVVAAHRGYAVVEQHPPAAAGDRPGEGPVLRGRVAQQRAVGAPQQAADDGAAAARG